MKRIVALILMCCMMLSLAACSVAAPEKPAQEQTPVMNQTPVGGTVTDLSNGVLNSAPKGEYIEGVVLVKVEETLDAAMLGELAYTSAEELYTGSKWYSVQLAEGGKAEEAVEYLLSLDTFDGVDYDYVMGVTAEVESVDISGNPAHNKQNDTFKTHHIKEGWDYLKKNGLNPGGSPDVVVAVIDTGVDYNHLDLRNNIWINTAEIPNNRKDDDGNGYVDDIYGWDFVGNDNNPMDDNGHGTHVAGIIAAENNKIGGIGVAYNCKVMVLKAGNSSGYFNSSDIAEAIQYAYMNGASVINMSFGGSSISIAVEEALENAYNSCVLVAAAGNDGACNKLDCSVCFWKNKKVCYPAALPYVIGVMSTDKDGKHISSFSNYDHHPYDSIEYEVYAVGEGVYSTWPNNKYATLSGTSMATPTVAGIAALLRSYYSDRDMYSTKFIQSQIVNTGIVNLDGAHTVADVQEALTKLPKPEVNLYDYYIDDSTSISSKNNGNGVVDAGETIRLYISLHNRGGVASNVNVTIDTYRNEIGNEALTDPYFTFVNPTMQLSDIGTYSVRESGEKYFEIIVDANCPNDYLTDFNIRFTYTNGMDEKDDEVYNGNGKAQLTIYKGMHLPREITSDLILTNDNEYIVSNPVFIHPGVEVLIQEGVTINLIGDYKVNRIVVGGTLRAIGSSENMIHLNTCVEKWRDDANVYISYVTITMYGAKVEADEADHCLIAGFGSGVHADTISNSVMVEGGGGGGQLINCIVVDGSASGLFDKCVFHADSSMLMSVNRLVPGTTNVLLNSDARAKPPVHNQNGLISGSRDYLGIVAPDYNKDLSLEENTYSIGPIYWGTSDQTVIDSYVYDFYDDPDWAIIDTSSFLATPPEDVWPFVVDVSILNKAGEKVTTISKEEVTFVVEFNRDMDTTVPLSVKFGTIQPYADYVITGEFITPRTWVGKYTLKASIENGIQYINISNGRAVDDHFLQLYEPVGRFAFNIDATAAMSMNLIANPTENGIELNFAQDDYDTLLGYNIYRSKDKDGNFVRLNPTILPPDENTFLDENAEPGKTYWYTYTVVLTDFSESTPAGKVQATATDTWSPSLYHTPVNQGYENNNLVISATASDNVGIQSVTLYYRTVGATQWKSLVMSKQNDKFNATIFGSDVTLAGIEYYIIATDGINTVNKGSAETPYTVVVKSADSLLGMGDVDGNGQVTTKDALMLMQCLNGDLILTDDAFKRADLNGDKVLSAAEALRILQYINGNVNTLEM